MFLSLLLTFTTFASEPTTWKYKKISSVYSKVPAKIAELEVKYPEIFEDYNDLQITAVTVENGTYTFTGPSQCQANDPRLKLEETFIRYICYLEEEDDEICEDYEAVEMPDIDPCSDLFKNNQ